MYGQNHPKRIELNNQIKEWNSNRLDLFEISEPNEYLEFYGVMRFFYQGDDLKYQTKCLRVSSTATTLDLLEAVVVKFHPDLKMLGNDKYALYESHNVQDRRLKDNENPLIVQLNWALDDKDGKFILRNESRRRRSTDLTGHGMLNNYGMSKSTSALGSLYGSQTLRSQSSAVYSTSSSNLFSKRMLSSKKGRRKSKRDSIQDAEEAQRIAAELSGKPPESSFTRTISNPDEVMKRRRQRKLESRLEQFSGDNETGGTLKIYGDSINPDIPYKTLLLSVNDTTEKILQETLDKYGLAPEDHRLFLLVQQNIPPKNERSRGERPEEIILHNQDCPLGILVHCPPKRGNAIFAVRKKTSMDRIPAKPRMPPFFMSADTLNKSPGPSRNTKVESNPTGSKTKPQPEKNTDRPRLLKLSVDDNGNLFEENEIFSLSSLIINDLQDVPSSEGSKFIKIGSQSSTIGNYPNILLPQDYYYDIRPTHCHISTKLDQQSNAIKFILTPTLDSSSRTPKPCLVYINQQKTEKSTKLEDEDIIQIGESVLFKFEDVDIEQQKSLNNSLSVSSNTSVDVNVTGSSKKNFTSELPISVKYSYNLIEEIIEKTIDLSKEYSEYGSKDLFGSNTNDLFRLSPAYMLYLLLRSGLRKEKYISHLIDTIAQNISQVIQEDKSSVEKEVFWLSNTSELLHLLQCDNDLRNFSGPAQDVLASGIEQAFTNLQSQFSQDLLILLPAFLDSDDSDLNDDTREDISPCLDRACVLVTYGDIDYPIQHLLQTLSLAYTLFHNCQVNVALTIQMFSQLFHLLNTWLFNSVVGDPSNSPGRVIEPLRVSPEWGARLSRRLSRIRDWSEKNGLDMAANCHLQKMYQVAELMEADKSDLNIFGEKCLEFINLNGTQLHFLLENCEDYELPNAWIEVVVNTAIQWHDQAFSDIASQNKNELPLYEDLDLRLPLLLPADGYCCDRGIVSCPKDLKNMLDSFNGTLLYKLNPPTVHHEDSRWKAYLGPYENTPSVSRSGTLIEQSPHISVKENPQLGLPRNLINVEKNNFENPDSRSSNTSAKRPTELSLENHRQQSIEFDDESEEAEVPTNDHKNQYTLKLKKIENSLGLSIIAAKKSQNDIFRIFIKDVIPGGAGYKSGKIETGDQLVSVDGILLENINQDEAVEFMKKTKSTVNLLMERGAAQKYGVLEIIMKSKSLKTTAQLNQKKQPNLPNKNVKIPPTKSSTNQMRITSNRPSSSSQQLPRVIIRENIPSKDPIILENGTKKRTDYNLPPVPELGNASSKTPKTSAKNQTKTKIEEDSVDKEYFSLPNRNHRSNQVPSQKIPIYSTVNKVRSSRDLDELSKNHVKNENLKFNHSHSQPDLMHTVSMKQNDLSDSSNTSSTESTLTTTDEEDSIENKPPVNKMKNSNQKQTSLYTKSPQPPTSNQKLIPQKVPVKAMSDNNIQISGKEPSRNTVSSNDKQGNRKNQMLTSSEILPNSEPIMVIKSDNSISSVNLQSPVHVSKKKNRPTSSTSESESETLSSITQSLSSDQSPKPQKKINSEPIMSMRLSESSMKGISNNVSNIEKSPNSKSEEWRRLSTQSSIEEKSSQDKDKGQKKNEASKFNQGKTFQLPQNVPMNFHSSSFPTISSHQYNPPSVLEENDWSTIPKRDSTKIKPDEEIKMRRKIEQVPSSPDNRPQSTMLPETKDNKHRNSARYGRPQFNGNYKANQKESQSQFSSNSNNSQHDTFNPLPPPPALPSIIVIPGSPTDRSTIFGINEVYNDPYNKKESNQAPESNPVELLSFQDKIKLFAQKNGENEIVIRNKFSSKQRKIESAEYE